MQSLISTNSVSRCEGPNLALRLIQPEDAEYVYALRTDPEFGSNLSAVTGTVDDQRRWIDSYKTREAKSDEFYYIVERRDGQVCGTVRLYDIGVQEFTWGSWILDRKKPRLAALESAVLSFGVGFHGLGLARALVDVRAGNHHAQAFYRRFGMSEIKRTEQDIYFEYSAIQYAADLAGYLKIFKGKT